MVPASKFSALTRAPLVYSLRHRRNRLIPRKITILNLSIGRGHPFYLDGIVEALNRSGHIRLVRVTEDVLDVASGCSRLAWKGVRSMYHVGSNPGLAGRLYTRLRHKTDYNRPTLAQKILSIGLRNRYSKGGDALVVSHPVLVGIFQGRDNLIYQHGELATPAESLVRGASLVIVPTKASAESFAGVGYQKDNILVSGLCVEPSLVRMAWDMYQMRLERIAGSGRLTGAFFSSGAEPGAHVEKLVAAALAAIFLEQSVLIFAKRGGKVAKEVMAAFQRHGLPLYRLGIEQQIPSQLPEAILVEFGNRREETHFTTRLFPAFDYFVAPSHERSNWAVGLGLPMFILEPAIGCYAPINRQVLLEQGVAASITSMQYAQSFGARMESLRNKGTLLQMARAGWGKYDIRGFETIAAFLAERFGEPSTE